MSDDVAPSNYRKRKGWRGVNPARPPEFLPHLPARLAARLEPTLALRFDEALAQHPDLPLAFQPESTPLPGLDAYQPRGNSVKRKVP
jgi:hypothetical protein